MKEKTIKYKYLWAWDTMMCSFPYWKEIMQAKAEEDNAPLSAIYKNSDGTWVTFEEIKSPKVKARIAAMVGS